MSNSCTIYFQVMYVGQEEIHKVGSDVRSLIEVSTRVSKQRIS